MATARAGPAGRGCGRGPGAPPPPGWPPGRTTEAGLRVRDLGQGRALGGKEGQGRTGAAARGAVPVVRGLAHQAGRLCFLPGKVAVEGQHRGVAVLGLCGQTVRSAGPVPVPAPPLPARRPRPGAQRGAGATSVPALQVLSRLQQDQQGVQLHPPARPRAPGRRRPLPGPLRPAPLAACPARPAAPLPRLPQTRCALGRHPPPRVLKLTLKGERRPAQPMGSSTWAPGADVGTSRANENQPNASGRAENVDRCEGRFG